ncbi:hypothetical protein D3P96_00455 [Weissella viridescens]|uniref:Uncharacterized protein n=1 Tax=Weissella viridescens TaxID=1629 RepID=A0A3P2RD29_WEIVI|nr:hypothetical protein [Weissella viridescens]RRG18494.1 hypothetical protein D3P96_00455 [Weissella viridescens]
MEHKLNVFDEKIERQVDNIFEVINNLVDLTNCSNLWFFGNEYDGLSSVNFWYVGADKRLNEFAEYHSENQGIGEKLTADMLEIDQLLIGQGDRPFRQILINYTVNDDGGIPKISLDYYDWPEIGFPLFAADNYYKSVTVGEKYVKQSDRRVVHEMLAYVNAQENNS